MRLLSNQRIPIQKTTVIRAVLESLENHPVSSQAVATYTYVFPDSVFSDRVQYYDVEESLLTTSRSVNDQFKKFIQDPKSLARGGDFQSKAIQTFYSMPVISIVAPRVQKEVENPSSIEIMEWVAEGGTRVVQADAGVQFFGNSSLGFPKKNYKFSFSKTRYGVDKFRMSNLFEKWGGIPVRDEFNELLVRSGAHDSLQYWFPQLKGQYTRNEWANKTFFEMGHLGVHMRTAHVFYNGSYFGIFQLMERPNSDHMSSYMGLNAEDYTALRTSCTTNVGGGVQPLSPVLVGAGGVEQVAAAAPLPNGGLPIWGMDRADEFNTCYNGIVSYDGESEDWMATLFALSQSKRGSSRVSYREVIDYMILNYYAGNTDWFSNWNWAAGLSMNKKNGLDFFHEFPLRYFPWDNDFMLVRNTENLTRRFGPGGSYINGSNVVTTLIPFLELLKNDPDFLQMFIDRSHELLNSSSGILTPNQSADRYWDLGEKIKDALPLEYARWYVPESERIGAWQYPDAYTFYENWIAERNRIVGTEKSGVYVDSKDAYFPQRSATVLRQIRESYLESQFTQFDPPQLTSNFTVYPLDRSLYFANALSSNQSLYYTTDGTDPRLAGGELAPFAIKYSINDSTLKVTKSFVLSARILEFSPATGTKKWSALFRRHIVCNVDAPAVATHANLALTFIHYNPLLNTRKEYFILKNISNQPLDLNGVQVETNSEDDPLFLKINHSYILMPKEEVIFARSASLMETVLSVAASDSFQDLPKLYPDSYDGKLSNAGATLTIKGPLGDILSATYSDKSQWPRSADGRGDGLELNAEKIPELLSNPNVYSLASSWKASPVDREISQEEIGTFVKNSFTRYDEKHLQFKVSFPQSWRRHYLLSLEESNDLKNWKILKNPLYQDEVDSKNYFFAPYGEKNFFRAAFSRK